MAFPSTRVVWREKGLRPHTSEIRKSQAQDRPKAETYYCEVRAQEAKEPNSEPHETPSRYFSDHLYVLPAEQQNRDCGLGEETSYSLTVSSQPNLIRCPLGQSSSHGHGFATGGEKAKFIL